MHDKHKQADSTVFLYRVSKHRIQERPTKVGEEEGGGGGARRDTREGFQSAESREAKGSTGTVG